MFCLNCNSETKNPKFCSKGCAATYNNKFVHKRKPVKRFCKYCKKEIPTSRYLTGGVKPKKVCNNCNKLYVNWSEITKLDLQNLRKYQANSRIRDLARQSYYKINPNKICQVCGYSNHVEVCHIKSIQSFTDSAKISEINSPLNLIYLCPNHHWELDNGKLNLLYPLS